MRLQNNQTIGQSPKITSEIEYVVERLNTMLVNLQDTVASLEQRVTPLIQDQPDTCGGTVNPKEDKPVYSALGREIMEKVYRVESLQSRVERLLDLLAV